MKSNCLSSEDLLPAALGGEGASWGVALDRHVRECSLCALELNALRDMVPALYAGTLAAVTTSGPCLDDAEIAALVDGGDPERNRFAIGHLASCGRCRTELTAVTRLVRDPTVAEEIAMLEPSAPRRRGLRIGRLATGAGLAAAALAGLIVGPQVLQNASEGGDSVTLRERAITTTAAPRIVEPLGVATLADSLRWTSVPRADLYRVTLWDREGSVVWEGETRDTVLALPEVLAAGRGAILLWDVEARTGWGRWVASELVELAVPDRRRTPR